MLNLSRDNYPILFLLSSILLLANLCQAQETSGIIINEIAWMGTKTSYNDEWLELFNNTNQKIDLTGWQLAAQDGAPIIILSGKINAGSFYLLERTDDNTLPQLSADQIYSGALGNNGEYLILYDSTKNIIDSLDCSGGWFAGDNDTKQTMERKNLTSVSTPDNWQISQNAGGTPRNQNSSSALSNTTAPLSVPVEKAPEIISQSKKNNLSQAFKNSATSSAEKLVENPKNNLLASVGKQTTDDKSSFPLVGVALIFALICGGVILFLKGQTNRGLE